MDITLLIVFFATHAQMGTTATIITFSHSLALRQVNALEEIPSIQFAKMEHTWMLESAFLALLEVTAQVELFLDYVMQDTSAPLAQAPLNLTLSASQENTVLSELSKCCLAPLVFLDRQVEAFNLQTAQLVLLASCVL